MTTISLLTWVSAMFVLLGPTATLSDAMSSSNAEGCPEEVTVTDKGVHVKSPGYPTNYKSDISCAVSLNRNDEKFTEITIIAFHLESIYDYLKLSGPNYFIFLVNASTNRMHLIGYPNSTIETNFTSDSDREKKGFELKAKSVSATELHSQCQGVNNKSKCEVMSSPLIIKNYRDMDLANNLSSVFFESSTGTTTSTSTNTWVKAVESLGGVTLQDITKSGFTVTWQPVGGATYSVVFDNETSEPTTTSWTKDGLQSGTPFTVTIIYFSKLKKNVSISVNGTTTRISCEESTERLPDGRNVTFNRALVGTSVDSVEKCENGRALATIECKANGDQTNLVNLFLGQSCNITSESIISKTTILTDIVAFNSTKLEISAKDIEIATSGSNVSKESVEHIAQFFKNVSEIAKQTEVGVEPLEDCVNTIDNLIKSKSISDESSSSPDGKGTTKDVNQELLHNLISLASSVKLSKNKTGDLMKTHSISLEIVDYNGTTNIQKTPEIRKSWNDSDLQTINPVKVTVPASALLKEKQRTNDSTVRIVFIVHMTPIFFPAKRADVGAIITAHVGDEKRIDGFKGQVEMEFNGNRTCEMKTNGSRFKRTISLPRCVYWNTTTQDWDNTGCFLVLDNRTNPVKCACNHLTSFAVLMANEKLDPNIPLEMWTIVGLSLSMAGLVLTIFIHALKEDVRKRRPTQILFLICANLIISHSIFLLGVERIGDRIACTIIAACMHFFYLASWTWMTVYAYDMYHSLVLVFGSGRSHNMKKYATFGYGIPLLITSLDVGVSVGYIDPRRRPKGVNETADGFYPQAVNTCTYKESAYVAENICWIHEYSLYIGFLLPVAIMLALNIYVYVMVIKTLIRRKSAVQSTAKETSIKEYFFISVTLIASTGIPWIVGYLMLVSKDIVYLSVTSWIFSILNTLQGFLIFLCTCVRNQNMRNIWLQPLKDCFNLTQMSSKTDDSKNVDHKRLTNDSSATVFSQQRFAQHDGQAVSSL